MLRVVGPAVLGLALAAPAAAQMTPIFRMDCGTGGSRYPACGFDYVYTEHEGRYFTRTRVPGGSPSGRDSVRMAAIPGSANAQYEWGWIYTPRTAVPQGATRYIRWRFKIVSPVRWRAVNGNAAGGKLVILGNTCEKSPHSPTRVISNLDASGGTTPFLRTEQNISGPPSRLEITSGLQADVWHNVQLRIRSSSTASSTDGLLSQYQNTANANEGSPTAQSSGGFNLKTTGWSTVGCADSGMAFGNTFNALASGENFVIEVADFEYDDQFDPNWHTPGSGGGGTGPISAPQGVRIVTAGVLGLLPLSALTMVVGSRRRARQSRG
jgi:hypothetical protein